jgi:hypothetical protein
LITWWIEKGKADPKFTLMAADEALIAWAIPRLKIQGTELIQAIGIDSIQIQQLEKKGFRVRILSPQSRALDVVLPEEMAKSQASELLKALLPIKENVYWLSMAGTGIKDSDLTMISQFSNLRRLRIENNPISDDGIAALKNLTQLEVLNLNGTRISPTGLGPLAEIKSLRSLYLWNTAVNPQDEWVLKMKQGFEFHYKFFINKIFITS